MRLSVTTNIREVIGWVGQLHPQANFAVAKALSDTAIDIARELPDHANRAFAGGATRFTKQAFAYTRATKQRLEASVFVRPLQAAYLRFQIEGGTRQPRNVALKLPSVVDLDPEGNIPRGLVRQLVARAKAGRRATRAQSRRFGVSQAVSLFYGDPQDGRPAGIYKRVDHGMRHSLIPVVVFPRQPAHYTDKPFAFYAIAERIAQRRFETNLERAWRMARLTAR